MFLYRRFWHGKEWKLEYGLINKVAKYFNISCSIVQRIRKLKFHNQWLREKVCCRCNRRTIFKFILTILLGSTYSRIITGSFTFKQPSQKCCNLYQVEGVEYYNGTLQNILRLNHTVRSRVGNIMNDKVILKRGLGLRTL